MNTTSESNSLRVSRTRRTRAKTPALADLGQLVRDLEGEVDELFTRLDAQEVASAALEAQLQQLGADMLAASGE